MDGYWRERAELVLDEERHWQRARFKPSDTVRFPAAGGGWMATRLSLEPPPGGEVVSRGWDHEHCEICQKKIGRGGEPDGFFSPPDSSVCEPPNPDFSSILGRWMRQDPAGYAMGDNNLYGDEANGPTTTSIQGA